MRFLRLLFYYFSFFVIFVFYFFLNSSILHHCTRSMIDIVQRQVVAHIILLCSKATTLNRSFLSPSRLFSPSHRRGREKGQNCCKTKEMDRNEICNLPLRHRSSPAPPPLRFMLRCSVIFLFQRFLFFFYPFAPCARFVCLLSVSPGPRVVYVHAPALHFQFVSVSSLVVTCFFSLSLSYSLTLLFFFFLKTKRKEKKKIERKKSKRRLVVSSHGRRALVRW